MRNLLQKYYKNSNRIAIIYYRIKQLELLGSNSSCYSTRTTTEILLLLYNYYISTTIIT